MDPRQYDRIADLLMQIRLKTNKLHAYNDLTEKQLQLFRSKIDDLLFINDFLARSDAQGLL